MDHLTTIMLSILAKILGLKSEITKVFIKIYRMQEMNHINSTFMPEVVLQYELPFSKKGAPGKPGDMIHLYTKDKMGVDLHNSTNKFDQRRKVLFSLLSSLFSFLSKITKVRDRLECRSSLSNFLSYI